MVSKNLLKVYRSFFQANQKFVENLYRIYLKTEEVYRALDKVVTQQESNNSKLNIEYNVVYRNSRLPKGCIYNLFTAQAVRRYSNRSVGDGGLIVYKRNTSCEGQFKYSTVINTGSNVRINELDYEKSAMAVNFLPRNIYKHLFIPQIYKDAYSKIKSKPGNMTPGVDNETLDGFSNRTINKIVLEMKNRSFKFKPSRQLLIPKPNGGFRTLGVPSPVDKIVQSAIKSLIEQVYEPLFKDSSHGFRPNRGCHTALKKIKE